MYKVSCFTVSGVDIIPWFFILYLICSYTVVSRVSAHINITRLNITHDFGSHGRLPGI